MNGKIEPSAWARLTSEDQNELVKQGQWCLHVRDVPSAQERLYNMVLLKLGVDTNPTYQAFYRSYLPVNNDPDHAGTMDFIEGLRRLAQAKPDTPGHAALVRDIDTLHDTAMSIAEARQSRGTALSR